MEWQGYHLKWLEHHERTQVFQQRCFENEKSSFTAFVALGVNARFEEALSLKGRIHVFPTPAGTFTHLLEHSALGGLVNDTISNAVSASCQPINTILSRVVEAI